MYGINNGLMGLDHRARQQEVANTQCVTPQVFN
jgi:hypothetical protein